jgi:ribosomal protein L3 glutamine methyltransferase
MPPATTVRTLIERAAARLARARLTYGHGIPTAWDEAAYLALHVLKLPPAVLTPYLDRAVTPRNAARVDALVAERIRGRVPVAYLTREAWLGEYRFYIDERALVPRSYIAELLQERIAPWLPRRPVRRALDLCTGSGCLAIVLAKTFAGAKIDAVDIDRGALAVAQRNVADYRLQRRIRLLHSDMFGAIRGERYDLIIANPPYVSANTMRKLPREYRHEPALALASGRDGLDAIRVILRETAAQLTGHGLLVVEVGHHRRRVERAFARHPFIWPQTSGGDDCVFILGRDDLVRATEPPARSPAQPQVPAPRRASRANAASRRR